MRRESSRAIIAAMEQPTLPTLWTAGFFNERFPATVSPLAWSLLGPLIEELALRDPLRYLGYPHADQVPLTRLYHGHPYSNALAFQVFYKVFPDFLLPEDTYRYFPAGDTSLRREAPYPSSILSPRFLISISRAFLSDWRDFSPFHNYKKWAQYTAEHDRRVQALQSRLPALAQASPAEIFAALQETENAHRGLLRIHRWSLMHADLTFGLLKRVTRVWLDSEHGGEIAARLVSGVPNKTLEVDSALRDLAARISGVLASHAGASYDELMQHASPGDREAFVAFLVQHGHRSFSLDIASPTFRDDPSQVVDLLRGIQDQRTLKTETVPPLDLRRLGPIRRRLFRAIRSLAVRYVRLREDQRYYWQKSLAVSRQLYLLLADRLVTAGVIASREEVFYATHSELAAYFESRFSGPEFAATIAARRAEWQTFMREQTVSPADAYPAFLRGDVPLAASVSSASTDAAPHAWQARAISPGTARGSARVVQSAGDLGRVQPGDILVAPSTDPAWTPVFGRIAGLVLERGGVLSHGAVVAREYHVPAVAGITNIASEIHDGDMIQVDGNRGIVSRL